MKIQEHTNQFLVKADQADGLHDRLLYTFRLELDRLSPRKLDVSGDTVAFRGGVFRLGLMTNWNLLVPIGRGEIVVEPTDDGLSVRYVISFRELITVATIMILIMMAMIFESEGMEVFPFVPVALIFGWLFVVGGNIAIAIPRFNSFVRKCAKQAGATEIFDSR